MGTVLVFTGCASAGGGGCFDYTSIVIGVAGFDGYECDVTLDPPRGGAGGSRRVVIRFPATCSPGDSGLADVDPDGACGPVPAPAQTMCTAISGPSPNHCARDASLSAVFDGTALRHFVGQTFTVTVTCGGTTVIQRDGMIGCLQPL